MPLLESEEPDEPRNQFNLGAMLLIALAGVIGTTVAVWVFHFMHVDTAAATVTKAVFPRVAVLPFRSLSTSNEDFLADEKLTEAVIGQLAAVSRVQGLPTKIDTDPVAVGRELGAQVLLIGKIERSASHLRVNVQMVNARDGRQVWTGSFDGESNDLPALSSKIEKAVALRLTALLD